MTQLFLHSEERGCGGLRFRKNIENCSMLLHLAVCIYLFIYLFIYLVIYLFIYWCLFWIIILPASPIDKQLTAMSFSTSLLIKFAAMCIYNLSLLLTI